MDPDACLRELRTLCDQATLHQDEDTDREQRIVELFTALDEWMSKGGFAPKAWGKR